MKYRFQILIFFTAVAAALVGIRGFAKRPGAVAVANIGNVSSMLSASISTAATDTPSVLVDGADNALLGESSAPSLKPAFYKTGNNSAPDSAAEAILIADVQSGEKYLDAFSLKRWPIASLSKLLTAALVYEKMDLNAAITLAAGDFADGDKPIFSEGETYKTRDLLKAMLVASRNTAANALARAYGYADFVSQMNAKAKYWGMDNSHFDDPSGLSVSNQASASDLLKLVREISVERPEIWKTTENAKISVKDVNSGKVKSFVSTHQFVRRSDFYGGKTGYTPESDGNLISIFLYGKRTLAIIILGSADRFGDSEKLFTWFKSNYVPT